MTAQPPPPAPDQAAARARETQIMQAILVNCDAMGSAPEEAKRMAIRSIVNLRRAQNEV